MGKLLTRKERFIRSKCDRCGKATKARQNDTGDLFTLDHEYGPPLADQGSFCMKCCERYDKENWAEWFYCNRPQVMSNEPCTLYIFHDGYLETGDPGFSIHENYASARIAADEVQNDIDVSIHSGIDTIYEGEPMATRTAGVWDIAPATATNGGDHE